MNERRENLVTDLQTRLATEKESRAESERANHVLRFDTFNQSEGFSNNSK